MATKRRTPQHTVAIADDDWKALNEAAQRAGSERAVVMRALVGWYIRKPGAKLPPRPGE